MKSILLWTVVAIGLSLTVSGVKSSISELGDSIEAQVDDVYKHLQLYKQHGVSREGFGDIIRFFMSIPQRFIQTILDFIRRLTGQGGNEDTTTEIGTTGGASSSFNPDNIFSTVTAGSAKRHHAKHGSQAHKKVLQHAHKSSEGVKKHNAKQSAQKKSTNQEKHA